jgi:hypothetical protein
VSKATVHVMEWRGTAKWVKQLFTWWMTGVRCGFSLHHDVATDREVHSTYPMKYPGSDLSHVSGVSCGSLLSGLAMSSWLSALLWIHGQAYFTLLCVRTSRGSSVNWCAGQPGFVPRHDTDFYVHTGCGVHSACAQWVKGASPTGFICLRPSNSIV